jgi:hypothetical protein
VSTGEFLLLVLGAIVLGAIGIWMIQQKSLRDKFSSVGDVRGKTRTEIESVVGIPNSWSAMGDGRVLCQWTEADGGVYHIALIFKDNICEGISSESSF